MSSLTFMLQPVVMEYVSDWLVANISDDTTAETWSCSPDMR